jgi:hypothetical protein
MRFILLLFLTTLFLTTNAQTAYKVGDIIKVIDKVNNKLNAKILAIENGKYKIHYEGYTGDNYDEWIPEDRIVSSKPAKDNNKTADTPPPMNGSIPVLKGTAWWLLCIYEKGTTPSNNFTRNPYLFCNSGRWEIQTSIFQMGNYRISGNKLTQISDGADKLTETYTITWNQTEGYLELVGIKMVIRLKYNTRTTC